MGVAWLALLGVPFLDGALEGAPGLRLDTGRGGPLSTTTTPSSRIPSATPRTTRTGSPEQAEAICAASAEVHWPESR